MTGYSGGAVSGTDGAEAKITRLLQFNGNPGAKVVRVTFEGEAAVALFTVPHEGRRVGMTAFITASSGDRVDQAPDIEIRKGFV